MKSIPLLLSSLVVLAALSSFAFAALTVDVSLPSQSLAENDQVTATATITNTGNTESNIITSLASNPSWFSVTTSCTTIASLQKDQTGTSTCIITPTSTGTGLSLTATSQSTGGTSGSGTTSGITVSSASSSITSSISAPSSVGTSSSFSASITVTAPPGLDVSNVRVTASASSGCTLDTSQVPATQNLGVINAGTSKGSTNWQLTSASSFSTCTFSVNVVSDNGGTNSPSKSITVGTAPISSPSTGGGVSTTGQSVLFTVTQPSEKVEAAVTTEAGKATIKISSVSAGGSVEAKIADAADVFVTGLNLAVKNAVSNVQIVVSKLPTRPADVTHSISGKVFNYISIDKSNITDSDLSSVKIDFKVDKSWISGNNIDESKVRMQRYTDSGWSELSTSRTGSDAASVFYRAESPGLSIFAITGEEKVLESPITGEVVKKADEAAAMDYSFIVIPIIIAAIGAFLFFGRNMIAGKLRRR